MSPRRVKPSVAERLNAQIGYSEYIDESTKRHNKGERQVQCSKCQRWVWQSWSKDVKRHDAKCERRQAD